MRQRVIGLMVCACMFSFVVPLLAGPGQSSRAQSLTLNKQRIDFRNLGYRPSNLIEEDDSKITSLITDP